MISYISVANKVDEGPCVISFLDQAQESHSKYVSMTKITSAIFDIIG